MDKEISNRIIIFVSVFTLAFSALFLRTWTLGHAAPWIDELHSIFYARNSIEHLLDVRRTTDIHPPLYFLVVKYWGGIFGESREAYRLLSVTFSLCSIVLVFLIVKRLFNLPTALIACGFLATFPTAVHYGREIRMYPLLTVLFLCSFLSFVIFWEKSRAAKTTSSLSGLVREMLVPLSGFSISLALAFYTHYTAALYFMLYGLVAIYCLLQKDKRTFILMFFGLLAATCLVLPQLYHLFSSSLGDPDKDWMQPTTLRLFYSITMGAFPYPKLLKPFMFLIFLAGFFAVWTRDRSLAVILGLFTGGGMVLAAVIGIVEPIYLVRTIQVFTFFVSVFFAFLIIKVPIYVGFVLFISVIGVNIYTTAQRSLHSEYEYLLADQIPSFVQLLKKSEDQVFVKRHLQTQMAVYRIPLFEVAHAIDYDDRSESVAEIRSQFSRCIDATVGTGCRSVVMIIERENRFHIDQIKAWNEIASELVKLSPGHVEQLISGYRVVVVSRNKEFLKEVAGSLGSRR